MKATEFVQLLPDGKSAESLAERDRMIVQAVASGDSIHDWHALEIVEGAHRVLLSVSRDTLRIGEPGDSIRVSVSARAQEQIATLLGASLLTPKLVDAIFRRASIKPMPLIREWWRDGSMAWTSRMLEQGRALDERIGEPRDDELVANAGKDWVRLRAVPPGHACNYGWLGAGGSYSVTGLPCWQGVGTAHSVNHADYSQLARFVSQCAVLDASAISFDELLRHPVGARLVAHDGPFGSPVAPAPVVPARPPTKPPPAGSVPGDIDGIPFVAARHFTPSARTGATLIVIHSMEAAEKPTTAEAVAAWFAGAQAPQASAHFCLDSDSVIQCVRLRDVAWAAPGANATGIHLELAGYAKQTAAQWLDEYGRNLLGRAAVLVAEICRRFEIPIVRLGPDELKAGRRGICGHVDVTHAFHRSTHTDPGAGFPWTHFLGLVRAESERA